MADAIPPAQPEIKPQPLAAKPANWKTLVAAILIAVIGLTMAHYGFSPTQINTVVDGVGPTVSATLGVDDAAGAAAVGS